MRLATIIDPETLIPLPVIQTPEGFIPLRVLFPDAPFTARMEDALAHLATLRSASHAHPAIQNPTLLPPITRPATFRDFYAFEQHVKSCRAKRNLGMEPAWYAQPVFYFSNPVALVGSGASVYAPANCVELDFELEIAAIIGQPGKDIHEKDAWHHIAGFTILNDLSARDLQRKEVPVGLGPAKGKDFATAVGPVLVTMDELADRIDAERRLHLAMSARVNGRQLSSGNSASMYFTWPQLIAQASRDALLVPGDLIGSGTVGTGCILELGPENTGGWLKPGDLVELEIERLGILKTHIVKRPERSTAFAGGATSSGSSMPRDTAFPGGEPSSGSSMPRSEMPQS